MESRLFFGFWRVVAWSPNHSLLNPRRRRVVDDTQAAEELVGDAEEHDAEQPVGEEKHDAEELRERAHREHDAR